MQPFFVLLASRTPKMMISSFLDKVKILAGLWSVSLCPIGHGKAGKGGGKANRIRYRVVIGGSVVKSINHGRSVNFKTYISTSISIPGMIILLFNAAPMVRS